MKTATPPVTCSICKKVFVPVPRNKRYCTPACQKEAMKAQKRLYQKQRYERAKAIEYTKSKKNITMHDIEFFPVPDSKGQADFYSGLMV